jgi:predicted Zn-dependent protease with MMP-like domain
MLSIDREAFEEVVREALARLPREFAERIDNMAVVVEDEPGPEVLKEMGLDPEEDADEIFGLYQGTPLIERGVSYAGPPDRIVIYRGPILRSCASRREAVREIRETVLHELGHHFGLSDEEMPY